MSRKKSRKLKVFCWKSWTLRPKMAIEQEVDIQMRIRMCFLSLAIVFFFLVREVWMHIHGCGVWQVTIAMLISPMTSQQEHYIKVRRAGLVATNPGGTLGAGCGVTVATPDPLCPVQIRLRALPMPMSRLGPAPRCRRQVEGDTLASVILARSEACAFDQVAEIAWPTVRALGRPRMPHMRCLTPLPG